MRVKYHYEQGRFFGISAKQSRWYFDQALKELSGICNLQFEETTNWNIARLRFKYLPASEILYGSSGLCNDIGSGRYISINYERDYDLMNRPRRRFPVMLFAHEIAHCLLGFKHVDDKTSFMHAWVGAKTFSPSDAKWLQRRVGLPSKDFYPLASYGKIIRDFEALMEGWRVAVEARNAETDPAIRQLKHKTVNQFLYMIRASLPTVKSAAKSWKAEAVKWRVANVPFAAGF